MKLRDKLLLNEQNGKDPQSKDSKTQGSFKQFKLLKNIDNISTVYRNVVIKSFTNSIDKELWEEAIKDLKKILTPGSNPHTTTSNLILYEFFSGIIQLNNKNLDYFFKYHSEMYSHFDNNCYDFKLILVDELLKAIIKKLIINELNYIDKQKIFPYLQITPFLDVENYAKIFLKEKHSLVMTTIFISGVLGLKNIYSCSWNEIQSKQFNTYILNLIKENHCCNRQNTHNCVLCEMSIKLKTQIKLLSLKYSKKNISLNPSVFISSTRSTENEKSNSIQEIKELQYQLTKISGIPPKELVTKSRNSVLKISNQELNKDSQNSLDITNKIPNSRMIKLPDSCGKNDLSNYQKYISNTRYIKDSPKVPPKPASVETNKQSFTALSSINTKSKSNASKEICYNEIKEENEKNQHNTETIRSKFFENVFIANSDKDETNAFSCSNTAKIEHSAHLTENYVPNFNKSFNMFKTSFKDKRYDDKSFSSCSNKFFQRSKKSKDIKLVTHSNDINKKKDKKTSLGLFNMNYALNFRNSSLQSLNKSKEVNFPSDQHYIKIDNCDQSNSLNEESSKIPKSDLNFTNNLDLNSNIDNVENEFAENKCQDAFFEEINKNLCRRIFIIEKEIQTMESSIKDFEFTNNEFRKFIN